MKFFSGPGFWALFLAALLPAGSWAQQPSNSLPELETRLSSGVAVRVIDVNGQELDGRFERVSADSLSVVVDGGLREIPGASIREIGTRRPDKWWNGLLIGAGVGLGASLVWSAAECPNDPECEAITRLILIPILTGAGAGGGALIDRFISRFDTVYERSATSARFGLAPIVSRDTKGIRFSIAF